MPVSVEDEYIETYIDTVVNRCKHNGGFHVVGLRTEFRIESGGSFSCGLFGLGFPLLLLLNIAFIFFWLVFPFVTFGCLLSECCCLFPIYMTIVR